MTSSDPAAGEPRLPSSALLGSALDRLEEGIALFDPDLRLVYANAPFRDLRGYPDAVCRPGAHLSDLYRHNAARGDYGRGDPESEVARRMALAREGAPRSFDQRLPDGTILHVRYAPVPAPVPGAPPGLLFSYEDVTAKRRTESALAASERRAALVAEATTEGIYEWLVEAGEFHASPRLCELFGFASGEVGASQWDWNRRVHADDFPRYRSAIAAALKDDRVRYECEYRVRRKDGGFMWILDRGVVSERDAAGRAVRFIGAVLDISDKKLAEERLAIAVDAVNEGVYDWNIETDTIYYSEKVRSVLGLTPAQLAKPRDWTDRLHPDDFPEYRRRLLAHFRGESERFECEMRYRRGDGTWGWARQHGIAFRNESGRAWRMTGATGDISEQKALSAEVERQRALLGVIMDNIDQGISLVDENLNVVAFNTRFLELMRFPPERFAPGFPMEQAFRYNAERGEYGPGDVEEQVRERLALARRFEPHRFERERADGAVLEIVGRPVAGGGFVTTYTDVTERARATRALRESEERHALALEGSNDGIWDWDVRTGEIHVSDRLKELLGIEVEGSRVTAEQWQSRIHPEDFERFRAAMQRQLRGDVDQQSVEFRTAGAGGEERWVLHRGACVRDETGRVYRMAGSLGDITSLKRRENELREAKEAAERALEELRVAQRNLVHAEKMAALGELTAGIAHEIKNPLNFVNNFAATSVELLGELREVLGPALDALSGEDRAQADDLLADLADDLGTIREHGERADRIVRSMLDHAREGPGGRVPADLNALVEEGVNLAYHGQRATAPGFNATIERELDPAIGEVEVVPAELGRVLLNLLSNAFYAVRARQAETGDGYRPTIRITSRAVGDDRVEVRVRDNGTGIDPEAAERLFAPFYTTKPPGEGTGLGLSISHDIVVGRHGGDLRVESRPGEWTEFVIELPRAGPGSTGERRAGG